MPSSKLAFLRYMVIDRMLRNRQHKYPTKNEILEVCHEKFGVRSISTIEKDLNAMRLEFDAPILYHKTYKGYYYEEDDFQLFSVNLSDEQMLALSFVETFLEEFKYLPIFSEFSGAVDKVLDGLEITRTFGKDSKNVNKFIQIDKSPYFKGSDILSRLIQEIASKKVLSIEYQKFNSESSKYYTIHPYLLKEFDDLWYLTGYVSDAGYEQVRTFGIDRVLGFVHQDDKYIPQDEVGFNADAFFKNCYGITALSEEANEVILSFSPFQGNYLKSRPLHPTQKELVDNKDEYRISLDLVNNFELRKLILGFGANVKVLAPEKLKKDIQEELAKAIGSYKN
ncbi:WYL domain-containing protein [Flammeovirgaceae bacterium SG7u.111]|nr:WYL domain-containing protein [Flammeovirgaceae bacterium SG7u.132]WPO35039.1 WYL domain-containing protein [Flammeovirgaceae bacterium SG7u.111]